MFLKALHLYLEKNQKTWELYVSDESLYCVPEINITLDVNYKGIQILKKLKKIIEDSEYLGQYNKVLAQGNGHYKIQPQIADKGFSGPSKF